MAGINRLHHFDIIKGIAILLVVMGHVLTMCIREIDSAPLFKFIERIHMPIFFFISGYFTYKEDGQGKLVLPKLTIRVKQLLVPFFVMSTLWIYYFPLSGLQSPFVSTWDGLYLSAGKNGYWFTLCLFELIILYCLILPVLSKCRSFLSKVTLVVLVSVILFLIKNSIPETVVNVLNMPQVCEFFPIFMVGVLARSIKAEFDKITTSNVWITMSILVGSVLMYIVCWSWEFPSLAMWIDVLKCLLYICVVIVAIATVKPWSERSYGESDGRGGVFARLLAYMGSQSLAIYVLHYFFLFPMPLFREPLNAMNLGIVPTFVVASIVASIVIAIVLGANYIISKSDTLALLMTGKVK